MNDSQIETLDQVRQFLEGTEAVSFQIKSKEARYRWLQQTLVKFRYRQLNEAKQGKRTVLFVDAAHFVMGALLGMVWCFTHLLLPSASGRKRHNVLGAYDLITHEAITVTHDTYINQWVFGAFLDNIADAYAGTGRPITLVLDNARYQKCQSVADKAKELGIELLDLPSYSPNLNLIERLWRFVKKQVLSKTLYKRLESTASH